MFVQYGKQVFDRADKAAVPEHVVIGQKVVLAERNNLGPYALTGFRQGFFFRRFACFFCCDPVVVIGIKSGEVGKRGFFFCQSVRASNDRNHVCDTPADNENNNEVDKHQHESSVDNTFRCGYSILKYGLSM